MVRKSVAHCFSPLHDHTCEGGGCPLPVMWVGVLTRGKISCLDTPAWPRNQEGGCGEFSSALMMCSSDEHGFNVPWIFLLT